MCLQNLLSTDHAFPNAHLFKDNLLQVHVNLQNYQAKPNLLPLQAFHPEVKHTACLTM